MKNNQHYKLTLFGGFRLVDEQGRALIPAARKSKALLAWLAVNPNQAHPREKLSALLWPDSEEAAARHSLRQALGGLRKAFPDDGQLLNTSKDFISLNSELIEIDVQRFMTALSKKDTLSMNAAIELYTGEFLEGCNPHSDMFEDWVLVYRNDYAERAASVIEFCLSRQLEEKNYGQVVNLAIRLLAIDSVRESAYRALMLAHARLGNQASALRWYRRCQTVLLQELDVSPDPETQALYAAQLIDENQNTASQSVADCNQTGRQTLEKKAYTAAYNIDSVNKDNRRIIYQINTAIEGVLAQIGGQSFLIRADAGAGKSALASEIIAIAKTQGFFCCRGKLSARSKNSEAIILSDLIRGFSNCLHNYPNTADAAAYITNNNPQKRGNTVNEELISLVKQTSNLQPVLMLIEQLHEASKDTLNLIAELISSAGSYSMILLLTSEFAGEPLDPVWRGVMRGAPLTTIDMF